MERKNIQPEPAEQGYEKSRAEIIEEKSEDKHDEHQIKGGEKRRQGEDKRKLDDGRGGNDQAENYYLKNLF